MGLVSGLGSNSVVRAHRREDDHQTVVRAAPRAQSLHDVEPGHVRQPEVAQHEGGIALLRQLQGIAAGRCNRHVQSVMAHQCRRRFREARMVLDQQHSMPRRVTLGGL